MGSNMNTCYVCNGPIRKGMKIKELRVIYSTGIFNTRKAVTLSHKYIKRTICGSQVIDIKRQKRNPPFGRDERREMKNV